MRTLVWCWWQRVLVARPRNYTWTVPLAAAGAAVAGFGLLCFPGRYNSPSYHVLFNMLPTRVWGALFLFAGLGTLLTVTRLFAGFLVFLISTWTMGLAWAAFDPSLGSPSLFGWVWPGVVAAVLFAGIRRFGGEVRLPPGARVRMVLREGEEKHLDC